MATEVHHIYSHYDPEDHEKLEIETSQSSLSIDEVWEQEAPKLNRLRAPAPQFVPAVVAYGDWAPGLLKRSETPPIGQSETTLGASLSDWYRSLTTSRNLTPVQPTTIAATSNSSSSSTPVLRTASSSLEPESSMPRQQEATNKNNWFIMKAINSNPLPSNPSTNAPTLSDILERDPPPLPSQGKYKPPVWLEIGPSNKGFGLLQRAGWNEGEPLGPDVFRRKAVETVIPNEEIFGWTAVNDQGKSRQKTAAIRLERQEVQVEGMDDIKELRHIEVVDLTLDSDEDASDSDISPEEGKANQEDIGSSLVKEEHMDQDAGDDIPGYERMALLTPIATVLKSDRLGIGLKAKTVGPYKESKKRVTHNAAALAAHVRSAEESRRRRDRFGRGKKGYERQHRKEEAKRQAMIAYLKSS
ncbi:hypothetical protein CPB83DRAFT_846068 [Crepidotus variabilis]|uniref:G-patch domain-containing protein n=1 Tax=Crepidotus variabilis TaxID=179855 RepID=A0A9P6EQD3_9AGAR|nr:hypothetical protein CPB83DRAFT_846068 [Crepidotus variabilis]